MSAKTRPGRATKRAAPPEQQLVTGISPAPQSPREIGIEFRKLLDSGMALAPVGAAKEDPESLLDLGYKPRHKVTLFEATYYLTDFRHDEYLNFLVAHVAIPEGARHQVRRLYPRIFYKDASLVWRVASHYISEDHDHWIGKGDVRWEQRHDGDYLSTAEETTNLPYEIQGALDEISRRRKSRRDEDAVELLLRRAPQHRTEPYSDFTGPRRRASEEYQVNGGRPVARFKRTGDPSSLVFTRGFEPDFDDGIVEVNQSGSRLYGGAVQKYRVLSKNGRIQYQFVASPTHVFVNHPQTLTTELMSYGTRTHDVIADEDAFLPGFEYHFIDDSSDPPQLYSQIPVGHVGDVGKHDPERADASPWIESLEVIRDFRRKVLKNRRPRRTNG